VVLTVQSETPENASSGNEGGNTWICCVKVPGGKPPLKGFLVTEPHTIFGGNIPMNNPWLKLAAEAE
jgi:hypothetical protein